MDALEFIDLLDRPPARYAPFFPYGAPNPKPHGRYSERPCVLPIPDRARTTNVFTYLFLHTKVSV